METQKTAEKDRRLQPSGQEILDFLVWTGEADEIVRRWTRFQNVVEHARASGLSASKNETQKFADELRARLGLHGVQETLDFLRSRGQTIEDLERYCEDSVLVEAVQQRLVAEATVREFFSRNRREFDRARISRLFTDKEGIARELRMRVLEDGESFHDLAREHSVDPDTRDWGGYVGVVSRGSLPPLIAAKVFTARPGDLLGPFKDPGGFLLILVEDVISARLNDRVRKEIRKRIFGEWVAGPGGTSSSIERCALP